MTVKRFWFVPLDYHGECRFVRDNNRLGEKSMSNQEVVDTLNNFQELSINDLKQIEQLKKENEQLKKENAKLHQKIFEMRTNIALDRTEISRQTYTGEFLDLDEIEKW